MVCNTKHIHLQLHATVNPTLILPIARHNYDYNNNIILYMNARRSASEGSCFVRQ